MSPFFDDLEAQLRSAAHGVASGNEVPRARRRRRWFSPAHLDLAPVLATAVVVVLVVGTALLLLGHRPEQPPSPPASPPPNGGLAALIEKTPQKQLRREFAYMAAATKPLLASPVCQVQQPTTPSFVHRTPDPTLLSLLGALRRPATPADRVNPSVFAGMSDVYSGSVRRAFSAGGETYYLAVTGFDQAAVVPSNRCFVLQARALAQYLPKIPSSLRKPTQELQAGYIAYARNLFSHGPRDGICVIARGRNDNSTGCGITATQIKDYGAQQRNNGVFTGVVPDGVASVTLSFPAAQGRAARSLTGPVRGNVYAIRAGVSIGGRQPIEPATTWRSGDGQVLKTIPVPTAAMKRAACQAELVACTLLQDGGVTASSSGSSSTTATARAAPTAH